MQKYLGVILLCAILTAGAWYASRQQIQPTDPLRAEKIQLDKIKLERLAEQEKQRTEAQKRETAREIARIERQTTLESNKGVSLAAVTLAITWRLTPVMLLLAGLVGGSVYLWRRPVLFEFESIRAYLPRYAVAEATQQALITQERKATVEALAYAESVTQGRVEQILGAIKAIRPGRESANVAQTALPDITTTRANLPTFQEIFDSRTLHGDLILGYEGDAPRIGKYEAVHSCLIYGLARSGKTSWLRGLIGQTILTEPDTICYVLDPHAARKDSLLGSLPKTKHFKAIDCKHPMPALAAFGDELRKRLLSEEDEYPPRILLIDELNQLASEPYKPQLAALCEATAQRGRKVNVFLLATAQDVRERKIGDFRSSLSSAYFFKGKPSQVKAFLDDPDATKLYRRNVTRHGIALFSAADEAPRLMTIPECRPMDLKRLEAGFGDQKHTETPISKQPETPSETAAPTFGDLVRERLANIGLSQNKLAELAEISKKNMSLYLNENKPVSESIKAQIYAILDEAEKQGNAVETTAETAEETL
jgi:plasmid maintenance system antidote protein VapI